MRGAREHHSARDERGGFTLIELAVVLALIGLLVLVVAPRLEVVSGVALDTSARRLAARVRYLREEAALRGQWIRLAFDVRAGTYQAAVLQPTQNGARFIDDASPLFRRVTLPGEIRLDVAATNPDTTLDGQPAAVFSPDGFTDPLVIHLDDGRGRTTSIVVEPAVTQPRVVDEYVDVRSLAP